MIRPIRESLTDSDFSGPALAAGAALCEAGRYQRRGLFGTKEKGRDSCKNHGPGTLINSNGDVLPWMRRVRDQVVDWLRQKQTKRFRLRTVR